MSKFYNFRYENKYLNLRLQICELLVLILKDNLNNYKTVYGILSVIYFYLSFLITLIFKQSKIKFYNMFLN